MPCKLITYRQNMPARPSTSAKRTTPSGHPRRVPDALTAHSPMRRIISHRTSSMCATNVPEGACLRAMATIAFGSVFATMNGWMPARIRHRLKTGTDTASENNMKNMTRLLGSISCCALAACGPAGGERIDSNLECAALISASTYLIVGGKAEKDPALDKRALVTMMTHLNTYAVPKGITEKQAFAELTSLREALIGSRPPREIMSRARRCADQIRR
jgi:hypothetical protein